jgi:hypothetical protein
MVKQYLKKTINNKLKLNFMKDLNGNEYYTLEKCEEIISDKFRHIDSYTREDETELYKIEHVYKNQLNYVYLECKNPHWSFMKRYYKLVYSYGFMTLEYKSSNAIDMDKSYDVNCIKDEFKNKLIYLLAKTI